METKFCDNAVTACEFSGKSDNKTAKINVKTYPFTLSDDDLYYLTQINVKKSYKGDNTWHAIAISQRDAEYYQIFTISAVLAA